MIIKPVPYIIPDQIWFLMSKILLQIRLDKIDFLQGDILIFQMYHKNPIIHRHSFQKNLLRQAENFISSRKE